MAVGTMRSILRSNKLWAFLEQDVRMLTVRNEIGRALSPDEVFRLLTACKQSRSRSLYVAVLVSLHTGLRNGELRSMLWRQVDLIGNDEFPNGSVTVGRSKTEGGSGRRVPLSPDALACLKAWRTQFPACAPSHCLFPSEGYCANGSTPGAVHGTDVFTPILSWKTGWTVARKAAKVEARWHDLRHTFVSSLAAGQASDATIKALSGHVSNKMLERYSHTRNEAKCAAIAAAFGSQSLGSPRVSPKGDSAEDLKIQ
jgi:integrase